MSNTVTLTIRFDDAEDTYTGKMRKTAEYLRDQVVPRLEQGFRGFTDDQSSWDYSVASTPEETNSQSPIHTTAKKRVDTTPKEYLGRSIPNGILSSGRNNHPYSLG